MELKSSLTKSASIHQRANIVRGDAAKSYKDAAASGVIGAFDPVTASFTTNPVAAALAAQEAAFEQGYNDGLTAAQDAVKEATDDANKRVRRALAALAQAIDDFDTRETTALHEVENEVVNMAMAVARTVLQRELAVAQDPGAEAIARALAMAPRGNCLARLNPDDAATLNIASVPASGRSLEVIADPAVEPGGCLLEVNNTTIDAQLSSVMAQVADALDVTANAQAAGSDLSPSRTTESEPPIS